MAKAEAADFLRPSLCSYRVSLLPPTVGQKKSQGQPEFKGKENRLHLSKRTVAKTVTIFNLLHTFSLALADLDNLPKY